MIHKLIPVFRQDYNMLQIVVKHEEHKEEEESGYYMTVNLLMLDEGEKKIKAYKTHARQMIKKAKKESSYDDNDLKNLIKTYIEAMNDAFGIHLTSRDF